MLHLSLFLIITYLDVSLWLHKSPHHSQRSKKSWFLGIGWAVSEQCRYYGVIWPLPPSNTVEVASLQIEAGTTILSNITHRVMIHTR